MVGAVSRRRRSVNSADLTTLPNVKQWLSLTGLSDPLLSRMITSVSAYLQSWLNRVIAAADYTEVRNGTGGAVLPLQQFPVLSVSSLTIDGIVIPLRPPLSANSVSPLGSMFTGFGPPAGYTFDDFSVYVVGNKFWRGFQNIGVAYSAGYQSTDALIVPSLPPYTLSTVSRWSAGDRGVVYVANNAPFTDVAVPTVAGEYSVNGSVYTFSAADAGAPVRLTYASVPWDIEQACIDTLGDWYKYINRIGKTSEGVEGQTTSFVNAPIPARALSVLQQYKKIMAIGP